VNRVLPYQGARQLFGPKIVPLVIRLAADADQYREPFAGGFPTGLSILHRRPDLHGWINDRDPTVAAFWWCVRYVPEELIARIEQASEPTVEMYKSFHLWLQGVIRVPPRDEIVETAYRRLTVQYMSARHWGGGIRGGLHQTGAEILTSRWNPKRIIYRILLTHYRLASCEVEVTGFDFERPIRDETTRAVIFCDPPYYNHHNIYPYSMSLEDHERLATLLRQTPHSWVMTVGDHPEMRRLYDGCQNEHLGFNNVMIWREGHRSAGIRIVRDPDSTA
jgi:DNA adenine methylase